MSSAIWQFPCRLRNFRVVRGVTINALPTIFRDNQGLLGEVATTLVKVFRSVVRLFDVLFQPVTKFLRNKQCRR